MVREIVHDPILLARKSEPAGKEDLAVARDLLDTLIAHREGCVGMAANMIGICKRIIVFDNEGSYMTMLNPEIVKASGEYEAEEGVPFPAGRPPKGQTFSKDQGSLPDGVYADPAEDLRRMARPDHPA